MPRPSERREFCFAIRDTTLRAARTGQAAGPGFARDCARARRLRRHAAAAAGRALRRAAARDREQRSAFPTIFGSHIEPFTRADAVAIALREWRAFGQLVDDDPPDTRPPLPPELKPERMPGQWQRVGEYWWLGQNASSAGDRLDRQARRAGHANSTPAGTASSPGRRRSSPTSCAPPARATAFPYLALALPTTSTPPPAGAGTRDGLGDHRAAPGRTMRRCRATSSAPAARRAGACASTGCRPAPSPAHCDIVVATAPGMHQRGRRQRGRRGDAEARPDIVRRPPHRPGRQLAGHPLQLVRRAAGSLHPVGALSRGTGGGARNLDLRAMPPLGSRPMQDHAAASQFPCKARPARRAVLAGLLACCCACCGRRRARPPPAPWDVAQSALCTAAVQEAERHHHLPPGLLGTIARVESGRPIATRANIRAWPWTINADGDGLFFDSRAEAVAWAEQGLADGVRLMDVGCMQVNLQYHPAAFRSLDEAFDPAANAAYAARFLEQLGDRGERRLEPRHRPVSLAHARPRRRLSRPGRRDGARASSPASAGRSRCICARCARARCGWHWPAAAC